MIVIYEIGDIVEVQDDMNAGDLGAETIKLLQPIGTDKWEAITYSSLGGAYNRKGIVETKYLIP